MKEFILSAYALNPVIFWVMVVVGFLSVRTFVGLLLLYAVYVVLFN